MPRSASNYQQMVGEARRLHEAQQYRPALGLYRQLLKRNKDDAVLLAATGTAERHLGHYDEAKTHLVRAIGLGYPSVGAYQELSAVYERLLRFDDALETLDRGIGACDDGEHATPTKAELLRKLGRHEESAALLRPLVDRDPPMVTAVIVFSQLCTRLGEVERGLELVDAVFGGAPEGLRATLLFQRGMLLDRLGRHDEAWESIEEGNRCTGARFDPAARLSAVDGLMQTWTREYVESLPKPATRSDQPVFIVGMPRSGSSLVEQIAGAHPSVFAGGELPEIPRLLSELQTVGAQGRAVQTTRFDKKQIDRLGSLLARRYRKLDPKAERVTDKLLLNFEHLGLVSALLPDARVINCVRDPLDCGVSCYFQQFEGALPFAYDLSHIGSMYRNWERLMAHWKVVLDIPILDVVYEELVADLEGQSRRLIDFLGLEWDERCLRFYEADRVTLTVSNDQVRRPIYSASVGRYKKYEHRLGPLREALGAAGGGAR